MPTPTGLTAGQTQQRADWLEWRAEVEDLRTQPHGSLSVIALHRLGVAPRRFRGIPGEWFHVSGVPVVVLPRGEEVEFEDGRRRGGVIRFDGLPTDHSVFVLWNDTSIEVGERANALIVRPRTPDAPLRAAYRGTPVFDFDPRFIVPASFDPIDGVEIIADSEVDRIRQRIRVAGTARFALDHRTLAVTVLHHKDGGRYELLFRDRTSGSSTYYAGRTLTVEPGASPYELTLDFNRALNPNTAYAPFWTSALPPAENTLPLAIEAGEQAPLS